MRDRRILILQQRGWGTTVGHVVARQLHAEGASLAAVTFKRSTHEFTVTQSDVPYRHVLSHDEIMDAPSLVSGAKQTSLAEVCAGLGVASVWPLVASLRNHVRSYRDKYYYAFRQAVVDEEIIRYVTAVYVALERLMDDFQPELVVAPNFVAFPQMVVALLNERRGVPMLAVTDTKIRGHFVFTYSADETTGPLIDRVRQLQDGAATENREKARRYIAEFRDRPIVPAYMDAPEGTVLGAMKDRMRPFVAVGRAATAWPKNRNSRVTIDYRPPRVLIRDHVAHRRNTRDCEQFPYASLDALNRPFVYFPLQFQPEATIDVLSPYFNNQIEVARLVAQSLPDDLTLVVKEHPAMIGRRSRSYYEKLSRSPNVTLISPANRTWDLLQRATAVVAPGGTTIAEAALWSKPAVQLGNLGTTLQLPGVTKHTDLTTLSQHLIRILSEEPDEGDHMWRLENYVAAVLDVGFDVDYLRAWEHGDNTAIAGLWPIYRAEITRLLGTSG